MSKFNVWQSLCFLAIFRGLNHGKRQARACHANNYQVYYTTLRMLTTLESMVWCENVELTAMPALPLHFIRSPLGGWPSPKCERRSSAPPSSGPSRPVRQCPFVAAAADSRSAPFTPPTMVLGNIREQTCTRPNQIGQIQHVIF